MRAFLASFVLLASLSACGSLPAPTAQPQPQPRSTMPLRAWIGPPMLGGTLSFHVNRPAHVAIFEIVPGRGIGMIYPSYGGEHQYVSAGHHTVWMTLASHRWAYHQPLFGFHGTRHQPRFLYLVASEAPLRISPFLASPMAMRGMMGLQHFTAWNPYAAMDELTRMILPLQGWGDWTTDLYVEWPDPARQELQPRYVAIICRDGRQILVPAGYGFTGCPGENVMIARPGEGTDPDEGVETPSRRRPEPTAGDGRVAESPRARPEATGREPGELEPVGRERPVRDARDPEEARDRERDRPMPLPVRSVEPVREPRADPRRGEPRPARGAEPRSEPRSEPRPAPTREDRPAPPAAEPRRDPPPPRPAPPPAPASPERDRPRPSEPPAVDPSVH